VIDVDPVTETQYGLAGAGSVADAGPVLWDRHDRVADVGAVINR
jgi:hypothetical protein